MIAQMLQQRGDMVRDGATRLLTMRIDLRPRQYQSESSVSILILRSHASGVSKDDSLDAATAGLHGSRRRYAPPHHEDQPADASTSKRNRTLSILILRSRVSGVSKDESPAAATAGLHGS